MKSEKYNQPYITCEITGFEELCFPVQKTEAAYINGII